VIIKVIKIMGSILFLTSALKIMIIVIGNLGVYKYIFFLQAEVRF